MQVKVLRALHGQAVASGEIEVTQKNIASFAAELSGYLNQGFEISLTFNGKEVDFNKPMPASFIEQTLMS
jgi:hypothetical protein